MWRADHYQFFPLLIFGIAWFFISDKDEILQSTRPADDRIALSLIAVIGMLALLATSVNSSFLGAISLWLLTGVSAYWLSGMTGLRRTIPLLLLLTLIVPLPARFDEWMIFNFQFLASNLASLILDGLGLIHFREGVILITENDRFMTEEACSGIRSFFSSLAGIGFYCLVNYYPGLALRFQFPSDDVLGNRGQCSANRISRFCIRQLYNVNRYGRRTRCVWDIDVCIHYVGSDQYRPSFAGILASRAGIVHQLKLTTHPFHKLCRIALC